MELKKKIEEIAAMCVDHLEERWRSVLISFVECQLFLLSHFFALIFKIFGPKILDSSVYSSFGVGIFLIPFSRDLKKYIKESNKRNS